MSKAVDELREEYIEQGKLSVIQRMIRKGYSKEQILELEYTEEEYAKAEVTMCANVL